MRVGHRDRKFNAMSDFMPTAAKRLTAKGKYCFRVEISLSSGGYKMLGSKWSTLQGESDCGSERLVST